MVGATAAVVVREIPKLAIIGGPPTYLTQYKVNPKNIEQAMMNFNVVAENVPVTVLDHHILRDENWKQTAQPSIDKAASLGNRVVTAAEYAGTENKLLEAHRKALYKTEPPPQKFIEWTKMPLEERKRAVPPI